MDVSIAMKISENAIRRVVAWTSIASFYLAMHCFISVGVSFHEQHLLREAPRRASEMVGAAHHLRSVAKSGGTEMSKEELADIKRIEWVGKWFDGRIPSEAYEIHSSVELGVASLEDWLAFRRSGVATPQQQADPCGDRARAAKDREMPSLRPAIDPVCDLAFAVDYLDNLPSSVARDRNGIGRKISRSGQASLTWLATAIPFSLAWALLSRRRRRRGNEALGDVIELARKFTPHRPLWYRPVYVTLTGVGYVLLWSGVIAGSASFAALGVELAARPIMLIVGFFLSSTGSRLLRYSRPRAVMGPVRILARCDGRAPVLYLRSFQDDKPASTRDGFPMGGVARYLAIESHEELLTVALGAVGPVIAVGRPNERLPPLGASRLYFPSRRWRSAVMYLMSKSQLVVIRLGPGEELWWEFSQAVHNLPPTKVLALVPGHPLPSGLSDRLDHLLPESPGLESAAVRSGNKWISAVMAFDESWRAMVFPVGPVPQEKSHRLPAHEVARAVQFALATMGVQRRRLGWRLNRARVAKFGKALLVIPLLALLGRIMLLITELRK
ncbi:hypothetical protein [Streptomyces decoyicus]